MTALMDRIALAGPICSGKTTAADFIMDTYDHHSLLGFATPLYELASFHGLFPWTRTLALDHWRSQQLDGVLTSRASACFHRLAEEAFAEIPFQPGKNRTLLQRLGTEVGRSVDPELWTKLFRRNVERVEEKHGPGILNDNLRFINEYDCCRDLGFLVVYLDVSRDTQRRRYRDTYGVDPTDEQLTHASERDLPFIRARADFVLDNDGPNTVFLNKCLRQLVEGAIQPNRNRL